MNLPVSTPFRIVLITAPRGRKADALARGLVAARLAACVNVMPSVVSHYRWKGRLRKDAESLLIVKTKASRISALRRWIEENHPYEVPEVLALTVDAGSAAYLKWLGGELA